MLFPVLFDGPGSELLEANIASHFLCMGEPLVFCEVRLVSRGVAALVTLVLDAQMFVLHVTFERVGPRRGKMALITGNTVTAWFVSVQIVLSQLLGKHCGVLTVLTLMLDRSAVDVLNMLLQRRLVVGLERAFVADVALVGMEAVL